MKKTLLIIFLFFSIFVMSKNTSAITLNKTTFDFSFNPPTFDPMIITACTQENSFFNVYDTADLSQAQDPAISWWVCQVDLDISDYTGDPPFPVPFHSYSVLEVSEDRICSNEITSYAECKAKQEFISEANFSDSSSFSFIDLPENTTNDLFSNILTFFSDIWVLIVVAISVPLAFYVIARVIGLF